MALLHPVPPLSSPSKDAVYIDLGGSHAHEGEGAVPNDLVSSLMDTRHPLDAKMKQSQVALFKVGALILLVSLLVITIMMCAFIIVCMLGCCSNFA